MRVLLLAGAVTLALGVGATSSAAMAQGLPECKVGLHVAKAGALNYPATIVGFDKAKGMYQVKYDSGTLVEWLASSYLIYGCKSTVVGPTINDAFWPGNWSMFVGPAPQYQTIGGDRYLVTGTGAVAPPLTIKADGTYVWVIDRTKRITGKWRKMQASEMKYGFKDKPGILLMNGYDGGNWQVTYSGQSPYENKDQLNVERMDLGLSFLATRMKK